MCFLLLTTSLVAQDITNAGIDFWMAFTQARDLENAFYQINISSDLSTTGTVTIPGTGFSQQFTTVPGVVTSILLPPADATNDTSEVVENKAIHITSVDEVVVYASTYHAYRSEATLVLPTPSLGNKYRAMTYQSELNNGVLQESEFMVVAAGDTVTVEITTTANTAGGHMTGLPFNVTLHPGEIYQVQAATENDDLTGSLIEAVDPSKNFAVYSGNVWSNVFCGNSADPILEVAYPISTWGKNYILLPTPDIDIDLFRVLAAENNTDVLVNGTTVATLNAGEFYEDTISNEAYVTSDKPICVAMILVSGQSCTNNNEGDPSMVVLTPNEQMFLDTITFYTVDKIDINVNYVHVLTRSSDTSTIQFNGAPLTGFIPFPYDPFYSYASFEADTGSHTITTGGCGFLAYAIGLGFYESYAYAAGVLLTDLSAGITYTNINRSDNAICTDDTLQFKGSSTGTPLSWEWDLGDGTTSTLSNPLHSYDSSGSYVIRAVITYFCAVDTLLDTLNIIHTPLPNLGNDTVICLQDSVQLNAGNNGLQFLWAPSGDTTQLLTVDTSGNYVVTITNQACSITDSVDVVFDPTSSSFSISELDPFGNDTLCTGDVLQFNVTSSGNPTNWLWNFGDGLGGAGTTTTHTYQDGGTYTVNLTVPYLCGTDTLDELLSQSVSVVQTPFVDLGKDSSLCSVTEFLLTAGTTDNLYHWLPGGDSTTTLLVKGTGTYVATAYLEGCYFTDSITLELFPPLTVPNVFTPNGDGLNDAFYVDGVSACDNYTQFTVINRWGTTLFQTDTPFGIPWDGFTVEGNPAPNGVYFYILSGPDAVVKGSLTLLR